MSDWTVILDGSGPGSWNMALDGALLQAVDEGWSPPTVRFYTWSPPAVSLGRHQALGRAVSLAACRRRGYSLVRRPTGGQAVLHAEELTYAVVAPLDRRELGRSLLESYAAIGRALCAGCRELGIAAEVALPEETVVRRPDEGHPFCFQAAAPFEVSAGGRKLIGSAQRRERRALLQHGAIPIRLDREALAELFGGWSGEERFTSLGECLGAAPEPGELVSAFRRGFEAVFGPLHPRRASDRELALARRLQGERFRDASWTAGRRDPGLAAEIGDLLQ
jgi:lipoate-protein ligase A